MGFDINIMLVLQMCPVEGKPFYYSYNEKKGVVKIFDVQPIPIPKELREYLVGRGHVFHAYTGLYNDDDIFETDVSQFLSTYPSWEEVVDNPSYEDECGWTQEDHDRFKKLLKLLTESNLPYRIGWSY